MYSLIRERFCEFEKYEDVLACLLDMTDSRQVAHTTCLLLITVIFFSGICDHNLVV